MENAKVIEFPKEHSTRKRLQIQGQERKTALVLSIASVLIVTVFINQWITSSSDGGFTASGNRGVASFEPAVIAKDVKWEHHLARTLAAETSKNAATLAEAPTLRDELIFGFLEGKYGMKLADGRIESLQFIDAQAGDQPLEISDKAQFLKKYSQAFGLAFNQVSLAKSSDTEQVYSLIDASKQIVGEAHFSTDDQGRVSILKITR